MANYSIPLLLTRIITLVIAFTVHEFAHALTATRLGDPTPKRDGRLTLNPLKHLDLWGCLLLLTMGYGWAKPVRVSSGYVTRKHKSGMMWVSLAGPLSNFLMALIAALLLQNVPVLRTMRFSQSWLPTPAYFLSNFVYINLNLMIFNLLPIAPLDGEKVFGYFIPKKWRSGWNELQHHGRQILLVCFWILPYFGFDLSGRVMRPAVTGLYHLLMGG